MALTKPSSELYDRDYYAWVQDQVRALREHRVEALAWENVAEEIEDLAKSQKWSLEGHLENLIDHLLKIAYTPLMMRERDARLWQGTVRLARSKIRRWLAKSPSLRGNLNELFAAAYDDGRIRMLSRTKVEDRSVPAVPPWTIEQVLDDGFLPEPGEVA